MTAIRVEISVGELIDKITILEIKSQRIDDSNRRASITRELELLRHVRDDQIPGSPELEALAQELKATNEMMWDIEDHVRAHERSGDFGDEFVELARSVYYTNDRRAALKRSINELTGSKLVEEKSYPRY